MGKYWIVRGDLKGDYFYIKDDILKATSTQPARISVKNTFIKDMNEMTPGDICILTNSTKKKYIIISSIIEKESSKLKVKIIDKIHRDNLPEGVRKSLRVPRSIVNAEDMKEIKDFLNNFSSTDKVNVSFPLRADFPVNFCLPSDMTKEEANRLSEFLKLVYF